MTSKKTLFLGSVLLTILAWGADAGAQLKKLYDPQKTVILQGQIDKLETITRQGRQAVNNRKTLIAHLKTEQGTVVVHLGPPEFLAQQDFRPQTGDILQVTGGKVTTRRGEAVLAITVSAAGQTYQLRDANGVPVWTGQTPGCFGSQGRSRPVRS